MRPRKRRSCSCTYAVAIDGNASQTELQALAEYLSTLSLTGCEVLVFDSAAPDLFHSRECIVRWVARHLAVHDQYRRADGSVDVAHAAADFATTEKVIVASMTTRYTAMEVRQMCDLLERHDVVEPEEYVGPVPWWGGVEAGGMLLYRGTDQHHEVRTTFGFRRPAFRPAGSAKASVHAGVHFAFPGTDIHEAGGVFVRREPQPFVQSLRRSAASAFDPASPLRNFFFFGVVPLLIVLAIVGGIRIAAGYAGVIAFASVLLAVRGRIGASRFFPWRACFLAPLWIVERSIAVYWSLFARLSGASPDPTAASSTRARERKVSGE